MESVVIYQKLFDTMLKPTLLLNGFHKVTLKSGWISNSNLYENNGFWFGSSWDWRDTYLELNFGKLFYFKDVLPRVIVIGPYKDYLKLSGIELSELNSYDSNEVYIKHEFNQVIKSFNIINSNIELLYPKLYELFMTGSKDKKSKKYNRDFLRMLGNEVLLKDIPIEE